MFVSLLKCMWWDDADTVMRGFHPLGLFLVLVVVPKSHASQDSVWCFCLVQIWGFEHDFAAPPVKNSSLSQEKQTVNHWKKMRSSFCRRGHKDLAKRSKSVLDFKKHTTRITLFFSKMMSCLKPEILLSKASFLVSMLDFRGLEDDFPKCLIQNTVHLNCLAMSCKNALLSWLLAWVHPYFILFVSVKNV